MSTFFDFEHPIRIVPDSETKPDSLFGHEVKYSNFHNQFLVTALKATRTTTSITEYGAIYMCPSDVTTACSRKIFPDPAININETPLAKLLFGMSFVEISRNNIFICNPNIYAFNTEQYCSTYDINSQTIVTGKSFPVGRKIGSTKMHEYFGLQVEPTSLPVIENTDYIVSQLHYRYNNGIEPLSQTINEMLICGSSNSLRKVIKVRNFPGNKFLVNYGHAENFLMVPYPDSNLLLGAFDVFSNTFVLNQRIDVTVGTSGQQFGFSGTIGSFDSDECNDVIFTAPFYSEKTDQGAIMIYNCDKTLNKLKTSPLLILGDNTAFARFGISIANIKDQNSDNIDDIAVLASFWYFNNPFLYIYKSGVNGISQNYYQKIELQRDRTFNNNLAYKLVSGFDTNGDNINEIAVTYPMQNKFEYYVGVKSIELGGTLSVEKITEEADYLSNIEIKSGQSLFMCQLKMTVRFSVSPLNTIELNQKPILNYKITLSERENSFFRITGYPNFIEGSRQITESGENFIVEEKILYWYYPIPLKSDILVEVQASVQRNEIFCSEKCLTSDKISLKQRIMPPELLCENENCLPNLSISVANFEKSLSVGIKNTKQIVIEITYIGPIKSYYPQIIFTCPDIVKVSSYNFATLDKKDMSQSEIRNANKTKTYIFYSKFDFVTKNNLIFNLEIELIPGVVEENLDLIFLVKDAMFKQNKHHSTVIKLNLGHNPILFTGITVPNYAIVPKREDNNVIKSERVLSYKMQVFNTQLYLSIDDVYIIFKLPILYDDKITFDVNMPDIDSNKKKIKCSSSFFDHCDETVYVYYVKNIEPNSAETFSVTLTENQDSQVFVSKNLGEITMHSTLKYSYNNIVFSKELTIKTPVKFKKIISNVNLIIYTSSATISSLLIIGLIVYLGYRFKLTEKFKIYMSPETLK